MSDRNNKISLKPELNHKMFFTAMNTLRENKLQLREYDLRLFRDLEDGYDMFGRDLQISVKQMNHIKQIAWDFEKGA